MTTTLESVNYTSTDGRTAIPSYVAVPAGAGPHPAILILRGVAGPEDGYLEIAQRVADWGYLALLHGWKVRGDDPPDGEVYADLEAAVAYLRSRKDVDPARVAVFGFCRGGVHALMVAAAHPELRVVVVFHGFAFRPEHAQRGVQPYDLARDVRVPVLIMHGTEDEQAPYPQMLQLEAHMRGLGARCEFKYYEGVRHGFAVRTHPGFEPPAARQSFEEARRFLDRHLPR